MKIKSCLCVHAERIYVEYLGATLLDMEHVTCYCKGEPRKVNVKHCDKCEIEIEDETDDDFPRWAKSKIKASYRKHFIENSGE